MPGSPRILPLTERGPLTARAACEVVRRHVADPGERADLFLLQSGEDIGGEGRASVWEIGLRLPERGLDAYGRTEFTDEEGRVLVLRLWVGPAWVLHPGPALPVPFRDSPEAVADLAARGADFVAGSTRMFLDARFLPSGEAVWWVSHYDLELTTPFT